MKVAAIDLAKKLRPGKKVVTVVCDTGLGHMKSALLADYCPHVSTGAQVNLSNIECCDSPGDILEFT